MNFQINPTCKNCKLHEFAHPNAVCLRGKNTESRKRLMVFTDTPDYFANHAKAPYKLDVGKFLDWCFESMSIEPNRVAYDYTLRCYAGKNLPTTKATRAEPIEECALYRFDSIELVRPKAIVILGKVSLEAFTGKSDVSMYQGRKVPCWEPVVRDIVPEVWVGYGLQGILISAGDAHRVFRVLYYAAQDAGFKPKIDPTVKQFQWKNFTRK
jgi:uracil-DNA glycosylase family 4